MRAISGESAVSGWSSGEPMVRLNQAAWPQLQSVVAKQKAVNVKRRQCLKRAGFETSWV